MKWVAFLRKFLRYGNYHINRPLDEQEVQHRLRLDQALPVIPSDHWTLIRMNDSYLEVIDRAYDRRGFLAWAGLYFCGIVAYFIFSNLYNLISDWLNEKLVWEWVVVDVFFMSVLTFFLWLFSLIARAELGRWTHYPIRLNRKTRSVYVFGGEGEVRKLSWDKIFFTTGLTDTRGCFTVMGHELDEQSKIALVLRYLWWVSGLSGTSGSVKTTLII
jgi:hypothetical protein